MVTNIQTGYCTNVHAGFDLVQTRSNLERFALNVKRRCSPDAPMGIGLWLAASSARSLLAPPARLAEFGHWLREVGLVPFTLNGFPYGDFHSPIVKHHVYEPTWYQPDRLAYTLDLITILDGLLPPGMDGSISTLPLAWGRPRLEPQQLTACATALREVARKLDQLERSSGRRIVLSIEPEPGCHLQYSADIVHFFEDYVFRGGDEQMLRRYLGVCHDVCHAAVMFEEQADVLDRYRTAGITVGKVQVSSAVVLPLERIPPAERAAAMRQLAEFNEERYLHQTVVRDATGIGTFYEDLPQALAARGEQLDGEWRVHFHVPVYLQRFGRLEATQDHILACLRTVARHELTRHFEVETYAWSVLPPELRQADLAVGISDEMNWFRQTWKSIDPAEGA